MQLLIVEDDWDAREMLAELFRMQAWEVTAVPSTDRALAELRGGHFDVVISDENVQGRSGSAMLRHASEQGLLSNVGVLMYTAETTCLQVPCGVRVLRKPLGIGTLLAEVRAAVQGTSRAPGSGSRQRLKRVELVLYVTNSPSSGRALANMQRALEENGGARVHLEVHNLERHPRDDEAATDRVGVTPVLVKRRPGNPEQFHRELDCARSLAALIEDLEAQAPVSSQRSLEPPPPSSVAR
jgi:DNA-binding response OmpR family regulator